MRFFGGRIRISKAKLHKIFWIVVSGLVVLTTLLAVAFPAGLPTK